MKNAVQVKGKSMRPYLIDGDTLVFDSQLSPEIGVPVLIETGGQKENQSEDKQIVHRYFGENLFKGDNVKLYDHEVYPDAKLVGVAKYRVTKKGWVDLQHPKAKKMHHLRARVSKLNHRDNFFNKVFFATGWVLSKTARLIEDRFLVGPEGEAQ